MGLDQDEVRWRDGWLAPDITPRDAGAGISVRDPASDNGPLGRRKGGPLGWWQLARQGELETKSEDGSRLGVARGLDVVGCVRSLGYGVVAAALEPVALAVHLQDVDVVGEPVQQCSGEPL